MPSLNEVLLAMILMNKSIDPSSNTFSEEKAIVQNKHNGS
jgi:hypothetical protein